jgi:hypothetical protein
MLAFLHGNHPWHIIKRHGLEAEIRVIRHLVDFTDKGIEVESLDAVDGRDEVRGGEAVLVGGTASTLKGA